MEILWLLLKKILFSKMSQVSTLLSLARTLKSELDNQDHNDKILGLLGFLEICYLKLKPYCRTGGASDYLKKVLRLVEEIKVSFVNSPNLAKRKAGELLKTAEGLAGFPTLQEV